MTSRPILRRLSIPLPIRSRRRWTCARRSPRRSRGWSILGVEGLATRIDAGSTQIDTQGLEAGLSYIGLVLESAERKIVEFWAAYEDRVASRQQIATVKYPDRYSLKTDKDRIDEATLLSKLMSSVPGQTVKREISKSITQALLGGKVSVETIAKVNQRSTNRSTPPAIQTRS